MAINLLIHNVDPDWIATLGELAAQHGRSQEEEHREILKRALHRAARPDPATSIARARELRAALAPETFAADEIDAAKRAGRK